MAENMLSGVNMYQAKEPAFSREQRQLLYPEVIYLPCDEAKPLPKPVTEGAIYLGKFEFDYPRMQCKTFSRYRIKKENAEKAGAYTEDKKRKKFNIKDFFFQSNEELSPIAISAEELVAIAERAGIVDETDGKLLADKLAIFYAGGYNALVCDAVDEQPYVSSNINTLLYYAEEVFCALKTVANCAPKTDKVFALCYADIDDTETVVPRKVYGIDIKRIFGNYPVRNRVKKRLAKYGKSYIIGTQALLHLYRAVTANCPQTTTIVTVAGDCVANPRNVEVRIGTPAREILEFCGLAGNPSRVIMGGSMRGVAIVDLDLPVLHTTRALIAFRKPIEAPVMPCISCGRCIETCPRELAPAFIYKAYNKQNEREMKILRADRCIECGVCTYICPANLELTHTIKKAKKQVRGMM